MLFEVQVFLVAQFGYCWTRLDNGRVPDNGHEMHHYEKHPKQAPRRYLISVSPVPISAQNKFRILVTQLIWGFPSPRLVFKKIQHRKNLPLSRLRRNRSYFRAVFVTCRPTSTRITPRFNPPENSKLNYLEVGGPVIWGIELQ
jgi:hypothetical protein